MLADVISSKVKEVKEMLKRFLVPSIFTVILFSLQAYYFACFDYHNNSDNMITIHRLSMCLIFGIFFGVAYLTFNEQGILKKKLKPVLSGGLICLITAVSYLFIGFGDTMNIYGVMTLIGLDIIFFISILYFSNSKKNMSKTFSYIFKNVMFYLLISAVIYAGLVLCVFAFTSLIYNPGQQITLRLYSILFCLIWFVVFFNLCFCTIPYPNRELKMSKIFRIIVLNTMFPIYILLISIFYIYFFKALFTSEFPNDTVNWLISISSLLYVFFVFSLKQYSKVSKIVDFFIKYSGFIIIPTILSQYFIQYMKISNDGLTIYTYISIICTTFALIFAVLMSCRLKNVLNYSLISLSILVFLVTITPLNLIDVPMRNQVSRLKTLLVKNNMLEGNEIIKNNDIRKEDKEEIIKYFRYIKDYGKDSRIKAPFLNKELTDQNPDDIFGFKKVEQE
jgi:hypothetical protein